LFTYLACIPFALFTYLDCIPFALFTYLACIPVSLFTYLACIPISLFTYLALFFPVRVAQGYLESSNAHRRLMAFRLKDNHGLTSSLLAEYGTLAPSFNPMSPPPPHAPSLLPWPRLYVVAPGQCLLGG